MPGEGREQWRERQDGVLELINEKGEIVATQALKKTPTGEPIYTKGGKGRGRPENRASHHYVVDNTGKKYWVPKGTSPDSLPQVIYPYCQTTVGQIFRKIAEGTTIHEIGKTEGFPPAWVIWEWKVKYPEFDAMIKKARKIAAEYYADLSILTAKQAKEKTVQSDRLRVDTYLKAAEFRDRETYGKQTKFTGDQNAPIAFMIVTGVPEPDKPPEKEVTPETVALPMPKEETE